MFPGYKYQNLVTGNQLQGGSVNPQNAGRITNAGASPQNAGGLSVGTVNPMNLIADGSGSGQVGGVGDVGLGGTGSVLDQAGIDSLLAQLGLYDQVRNNARRQAELSRDTYLNEKREEMEREQGKYEGKKLSTLQDFGSAKNETDLGTTQTLESLLSALSTMGLGGSRALTRQILAAANKSNRQANTTQAHNTRDLDTAYNDYSAGNENDVKKIRDQYQQSLGGADQKWAESRQNALYKVADKYNDAGDKGSYSKYMGQGNDLNSLIGSSAFLAPSYTGESRQMATPDLSTYNQDIAQYNTTGVGGQDVQGGAGTPGNLAIRAVAVNDKDAGVKKRQEGDLGYGV